MSLSSRKFASTLLPSLVLGMTVWAVAQTPSAVTDLPGYVADLQSWSDAVAQLPAHPEKASDLCHSVPLKLELQTAGQHFTVSNSWLVLALVRWENDVRHRPAIQQEIAQDRKSTRLNSSHANISYAVFCL